MECSVRPQALHAFANDLGHADRGAAATVAFYIVFNVGMVIGLLPVVGMPLPLISYGGTAMLTTMACFGLILSAHMHRDEKLSSTGII